VIGGNGRPAFRRGDAQLRSCMAAQAIRGVAGGGPSRGPVQYGGLGLSLTRQLIWHEEYGARRRAPIITCASSRSIMPAPPSSPAASGRPEAHCNLPKDSPGRCDLVAKASPKPNSGLGSGQSAPPRRVSRGDQSGSSTARKIWTSHGHFIGLAGICWCAPILPHPSTRVSVWVICDMKSPGITLRTHRDHDLAQIRCTSCNAFMTKCAFRLGNVGRPNQ